MRRLIVMGWSIFGVSGSIWDLEVALYGSMKTAFAFRKSSGTGHEGYLPFGVSATGSRFQRATG